MDPLKSGELKVLSLLSSAGAVVLVGHVLPNASHAGPGLIGN